MNLMQKSQEYSSLIGMHLQKYLNLQFHRSKRHLEIQLIPTIHEYLVYQVETRTNWRSNFKKKNQKNIPADSAFEKKYRLSRQQAH